ncbi:MAG: metal-dependent transcriptional regulator [Acidobacteria bacterium]|nr:metal-dependent transcriptional regulator [Acidobacteriota bacterium]
MQITISKENYLKAIAEAEADGEFVIAATLARWLQVSAPAVTMAIRRLKRDGCISVEAEGRICLTAAGRDIANRLLHRHYLIERMLSEVFGMEWYKVHDEAEQLEHAVSADFEKKLAEKLGAQAECPHGHGLLAETREQRRARGLMPLDELPAGARATVVSVFERDRKLLEHLDGLGIRPAAAVEIVARDSGEALRLRVDGAREGALGVTAAGRVWVRRQEKAV